MKILLIDPPGRLGGLNTGLGYLAGSLISQGYDVKVLDLNNDKRDQKERLEEALRENYDVVGLSIMSGTYVEALNVAHECKEIFPNIVLVAGGPEVTIEGSRFIEENPIFDYSLIGEAEHSIIKFLKLLEGKEDIENVKGLGYRKNGQIVVNQSELIKDLDSLPFPDYSVFDSSHFLSKWYPLVTSRGCPYNCIYCCVSMVSGKRWRARSSNNVIEELILSKNKYSPEEFKILDDNFTQDKNRVKEICQMIIEKKINISWLCPNGIRADRVDEFLVKSMKNAGCKEVWFGIETLNPEVHRKINKGESIETVLQAIDLAKKVKLDVSAFFIIGLPESTYKKDLETLDRSTKLGLKTLTWSLASPFPHTPLWSWVEKNAKILRDYRKGSFCQEPQCVFETSNYSEKERMKLFYKANLRFFRYDCLFIELNRFKRMLKIFKLVLLYDTQHILNHIWIHVNNFWEIIKSLK